MAATARAARRSEVAAWRQGHQVVQVRGWGMDGWMAGGCPAGRPARLPANPPHTHTTQGATSPCKEAAKRPHVHAPGTGTCPRPLRHTGSPHTPAPPLPPPPPSPCRSRARARSPYPRTAAAGPRRRPASRCPAARARRRRAPSPATRWRSSPPCPRPPPRARPRPGGSWAAPRGSCATRTRRRTRPRRAGTRPAAPARGAGKRPSRALGPRQPGPLRSAPLPGRRRRALTAARRTRPQDRHAQGRRPIGRQGGGPARDCAGPAARQGQAAAGARQPDRARQQQQGDAVRAHQPQQAPCRAEPGGQPPGPGRQQRRRRCGEPGPPLQALPCRQPSRQEQVQPAALQGLVCGWAVRGGGAVAGQRVRKGGQPRSATGAARGRGRVKCGRGGREKVTAVLAVCCKRCPGVPGPAATHAPPTSDVASCCLLLKLRPAAITAFPTMITRRAAT
jgi:hypothetical protein